MGFIFAGISQFLLSKAEQSHSHLAYTLNSRISYTLPIAQSGIVADGLIDLTVETTATATNGQIDIANGGIEAGELVMDLNPASGIDVASDGDITVSSDVTDLAATAVDNINIASGQDINVESDIDITDLTSTAGAINVASSGGEINANSLTMEATAATSVVVADGGGTIEGLADLDLTGDAVKQIGHGHLVLTENISNNN